MLGSMAQTPPTPWRFAAAAKVVLCASSMSGFDEGSSALDPIVVIRSDPPRCIYAKPVACVFPYAWQLGLLYAAT